MEKKRMAKKTLKIILIIGIAAFAVIAGVVAAIVIPTAMVSTEFDKIFDTVEDMFDPSILITDMSVENNFSGSKGEMLVNGAAAVHILENLSDAADDFKYARKENAEGSFDIRFKVTENDLTFEFYLTETEIYYVKNGKKYVFVPEDAEANVEYKQIYNTACMFVK